MLAVLRRRNFTLLWLGQLISMIGDWVLFIALPFYVYNLTGSTLATGIMFIAETIPRIVLGSVAGVFVDRWDRKRTMIVADISRAFLLLALLLVHTPDTVAIVYAVAFLESAISQFFSPARGALIPRVVPEEDLVAANALSSTSEQLTRLLGPPIGGALLSAIGLSAIALIDSLSFVLSAVLIILVRGVSGRSAPAPEAAEPRQPLVRVWQEWQAGVTLIRRSRLLSALFVAIAPPMVGEGIIVVVMVAYVKGVLQGDSTVLGWLIASQAVGGLIGSAIVARVGKRVPPAHLIGWSGVADGLLLLAIFNIHDVPIDMVLFGVAGVPVVGFFVSMFTLVQGAVADEFRGRVLGAFGTTTALLTLGGMGLAGALSDRLGTIPMLDIMGACYLLGGVLALLRIPRRESAPDPRSPAVPTDLAAAHD